jgi:hypothetical protein
MHGQTPALRSPVWATEVSPARKGWDCVMNLPERRRCGTTRGRIAFKISPIGSLIELLTNEYNYATLTGFCCSRPIRWGRSTLELPRSGRERAVSVMTHYEARNIEAGASWALHSVQPPASGLQILIATPANRNALNSLDVNKTYRSNRNKTRGYRSPFQAGGMHRDL